MKLIIRILLRFVQSKTKLKNQFHFFRFYRFCSPLHHLNCVEVGQWQIVFRRGVLDRWMHYYHDWHPINFDPVIPLSFRRFVSLISLGDRTFNVVHWIKNQLNYRDKHVERNSFRWLFIDRLQSYGLIKIMVAIWILISIIQTKSCDLRNDTKSRSWKMDPKHCRTIRSDYVELELGGE